LIRWRNRLLKLVGRLPDGTWHLDDVSSGLIDKQSEEALWSAFELNELVFICEDDDKDRFGSNSRKSDRDKTLRDSLSQDAVATPIASDDEEARKRALHRLRYVKVTEGLNRQQIAKIVDQLWKTLGWPSKPPYPLSILDWRRKSRDALDPVATLIERHDKKGRRNRHDEDVREILRDVRDNHYLKPNPRISVSRALKKARDQIRIANDQRPASDRLPRLPGRRLMEAIIEEIPARERYAKRFGPDSALNTFRYSLGGVHVEEPLDRAEVDHTPLAVVLLDDDLFPWGRANGTVVFDSALACPTGVYWGAEVPSIVSVSRATRHSVSTKTEFLKRFPNVKGTWPCFGVHKTYVYDNGLEEHAQALRQAHSEMGGSTSEFCGRKSPWFKPNVERYLRTQDLDFLQTIPGATMENFLKRCNFNPKKDLLLRKSTFDQVFMKWLVDIYLRTPLASLNNQAPVDAWQKRIIGVEQFVPTRTVLLERLFLRKEKDRRLDHEGIEYDCLVYNSRDMGSLRAQLGAVLHVDIWVSDENLGYIQVCVPNSDIWIRVPCLDLQYADGLTRWQHEKCKAMRRVGEDEGRELSLAQARQEIEDLIANEMKEFRHAHRKRRARFQEKDPMHAEHNGASNSTPAPQIPAPEDDKTDDDTSDLLWDEDTPVPELDSYTTK